MFEWFKSVFNATPEQPISSEEQVRIAAVALMYEVMRADGESKDQEVNSLTAKLAQRWQLDEESSRGLLARASAKAEQEVDYHNLVRVIRDQYSAEQRTELIIDMWAIAHADGEIDAMEEFIIRKIADLLYVPHTMFIYGKLHGGS